jgi:hypothetical protein
MIQDSVAGVPRFRRLAVVAQDPGVRRAGRILTAEVSVPYEDVEPGPVGHRVHVVDYDASTGTFYKPTGLTEADGQRPTNAQILNDPSFHAQNVYALVMSTLGRFEFVLGRRVGWGFPAHQLKVVPHAFEAANAYYSRDSESLTFGYYRRDRRLTFTCLSHDIVVHETTHALLDGLRRRFMAPSSPDQGAFHEGYADIIALLSVLSVERLVTALIDHAAEQPAGSPQGLIHRDLVSEDRLRRSVLFGLADEMEPDIAGARVNALRRSIVIDPAPGLVDEPEYEETHRRGEILVAAVMRAFLAVWTGRLKDLGTIEGSYLARARVAEEGAAVADQLLTMMIRALDYTPPIHLSFDDFLSAVLTADSEVRGDDSRYQLRSTLLHWFKAYGITPASPRPDGLWPRSALQLGREGVHFGSLQDDPTEMFRLVWANRRSLKLDPRAYTRVASVRPCVRIGPEDGLPIRETVAECTQYLSVPAGELSAYGLTPPPGVAETRAIVLEGGSTLILDEYGMLKFEINNVLPDRRDAAALAEEQQRINFLWSQGYYDEGFSLGARLSTLHRRRALDVDVARSEAW